MLSYIRCENRAIWLFEHGEPEGFSLLRVRVRVRARARVRARGE